MESWKRFSPRRVSRRSPSSGGPLHYEFASFDAFWDRVEASEILKAQYDALPPDERAKIRDEVAPFARDFVHDGMLRVPPRVPRGGKQVASGPISGSSGPGPPRPTLIETARIVFRILSALR